MSEALFTAAKLACKADFEQIKTNYFAADRVTFDDGKGGAYFTTLSQGCLDGISAMKTALAALPANTKNSESAKITDYEDTFTYLEDTKILVTGWQVPATSTTITEAGAKMGMCVTQTATSETAQCWTYKNSANEFSGYNIKPAEWNAKSAQSRKLDVATFPGKKRNRANARKTWQNWICEKVAAADADGTVIKTGNVGAICIKVMPNKSKATADDPAFTGGDLTANTYDSKQTTPQAAFANLQQSASKPFQGNEFYSYDITVNGAMNGVFFGTAALLALALQHF